MADTSTNGFIAFQAPGNTPGVSVTVKDAGGNVTSQGSTDQNGYFSTDWLTPGLYSYTASHPDFQDQPAQNVQVNAARTTALVMPMIAQPQPQVVGGLPDLPDTSGAASDKAQAVVAAASQQDQDFEQIYTNTSWNAYFTSAQVRVYIGDLFIDELQAIQYSAPNNVIPIFGYDSRFPDAWADGRSMVQGQLILNYVSETYLYTVLRNYRQRQQKDLMTDTAQAQDADARMLANALNARKYQLATKADTTLTDARIMALAQNPDAVRQFNQKQKTRGLDQTYCNAIYQPVAFDMRIEIGSGPYRSYRQLEKCKLNGNDQIFDQSGNVIADVYSFLARRIR